MTTTLLYCKRIAPIVLIERRKFFWPAFWAYTPLALLVHVMSITIFFSRHFIALCLNERAFVWVVRRRLYPVLRIRTLKDPFLWTDPDPKLTFKSEPYLDPERIWVQTWILIKFDFRFGLSPKYIKKIRHSNSIIFPRLRKKLSFKLVNSHGLCWLS